MRDYQQAAYDCTIKKLEEVNSALCVMATGLGKTIYFAHIVKHFRNKGRIMVLAHREELILQAQDKMHTVTGIKAEIEMADQWASGNLFHAQDIVVSTVQTQIAGGEGGRMQRFKPDDFSLLVIDEAHHAPADTYKRIIEYYRRNPDLKVLGVTATPDRHDKKAMGQIFEEVAYRYDMEDAIGDGWLVNVEQESVFVKSLDYSEIKSQAGDLNGKELAKVLEFEENLHAIADPTVKKTGDEKSLVFAASVVQAERLTEIFNRHKPDSADFVCGTTPKETRRRMFKAYAQGEFQYLVNVGVATEGFDDPSIQWIVMARPTKSRSLYAQMVGRGTRVLTEVDIDQYDDAVERRTAIAQSAKPAVKVLDFVGNPGRHKLITPADLLGGKYDDDVVELAAQNAAEKSAREGKPADIASELQQAEREMAKRASMREDAVWRDKVLLRAKFSSAKINPFNVLDVNPVRELPWNKGKQPTKKQVAFLDKNGIDITGMSYTHIKQVIDATFTRIAKGQPSYRQTKQLMKRHIDTTKITFEQAGKMMGELQRNKWKTPWQWKNLECYTG